MTIPNWNIPMIVERFEVSRNTVYREIERGKLIGHKLGKRFRFTERQIEDWLERRKTR